MLRNETTLPHNWVLTTLGEATKPSQKRVRPQESPNSPYIGMENIEPQTMRLLGTIPAKELRSMADSFTAGDVLYGRLRPYLNKVYCPDFSGLCSTEFIIFRKQPNFDSKYLQYFLNSSEFVAFANSLNAGDRPRVKFEQISSYPFPLPPLPEQERIVARIESLFTQLDAGVAALKRLQAALKRYRASVLKAACEGRLVPQDPADEPAEELLKRILAEKGDPIDKIIPSDGDFPGLQRGWLWVKFSNITNWIVDVDHKMPKPSNTTIPYISTRDFLDPDGIDFDNAKKISVEDFQALSKKVRPEYKDILLSRYGTVGEVRKVKTNRDFQASYSIAIIKTIKEVDITDFLIIVLRSEFVQKQINRDTRATAQPDLGLAHIRNFAIPIPPFMEQQRIVSEVERRLSIVQELEQTISTNLKRAARLRQSILQRAFEGRLVI